MRLETSYNSKYNLSIQCNKDSIEQLFTVQITIDPSSNSSNLTKITIQGNDETRIVSCFIYLVNQFTYAFARNSQQLKTKFPSSIRKFSDLLKSEKSYEMSISWSKMFGKYD